MVFEPSCHLFLPVIETSPFSTFPKDISELAGFTIYLFHAECHGTNF